jgi:hypothetical protein
MERLAVVSCHVERPLDDECWRRFSALHERRPGGFRIAALMRPPAAEAGEDEGRWLERAREAAQRGPLGHHTHFVSPSHARPHAPGPEHAERVSREAGWLREQGLAPTLFCGGGWYMDDDLAETVAALGYADCTATAFAPSYLDPGAPRLSLAQPARLVLPSGARLLELPSTHSLGAAAHSTRGDVVHVYFHDTDLLSGRRRWGLEVVLRILGRRRRATDLDELARIAADAPEMDFSDVFRGGNGEGGQ